MKLKIGLAVDRRLGRMLNGRTFLKAILDYMALELAARLNRRGKT